MKRYSSFLRMATSLLLCGWLAGCALPPDFEESEAWQNEPGVEEEGVASPPPRVVFEPPRFVTLPPGLMPVKSDGEKAEAAGALDVPFTEPDLPALVAEALPEVVPLLVENKIPETTAPVFPLLSPEAVEDLTAEAAEKVSLAALPIENKQEEIGEAGDSKPAIVNPEDPKPSQAPGLKMKQGVTGAKLHEVEKHLTTGMLPSAIDSKKETGGAEALNPEEAAPSVEELPFGIPEPGRPHLVRSPRASALQLVDVTGMALGEKVKCPFTGDLFRVPAPGQALESAKLANPPVPPN